MRLSRPGWRRIAATLVAAAAASVGAAAGQADGPVAVLQCTPTSVILPSGPERAKNPVVAALRRAGPGSVISLAPGDYPPFALGVRGGAAWASAASGSAGRPLVIRGGPGVRIRARGSQDTILIAQQVKTEYVRFEGLTIEPGWRAGVMFARGGVHTGFHFVDCHILGSYDHVKGRGRASKWGVWGSQLRDFVFEGRRGPANVRALRDEHAFYLQNLRGDVRIENVRCVAVGRTFLQVTARAKEGPVGTGRITVRDCVVIDPCLAPGDAHKGGSAITLGGRHRGTVRRERVKVRVGFSAKRRKLTRRGAPYGTGALVTVDGGEGVSNGRLILRDCRFEYAKGCGDRPVASVGAVTELRLEGRNVFVSGGEHPALAIDPPAVDGVPVRKSLPVGKIVVDGKTKVEGAVTRLGREVSLRDL